MEGLPERMFATTWTRTELMPANVAVVAGVPARLRDFVVPLGQVFGFGRGLDLGLRETEGRLHIDMRDNAAAPGAIVQGTVRLIAVNQLGQEVEVYWEGRTEALRLGATILQDRVPFPEQLPWIPQGFALAIVFISDVNVTLGSANTVIAVDGMRGRV